MALTAAGVGSGIDVENILSQLGEIERQPVVALEGKKSDLEVELSAFGKVKSALKEFQTAAKALGTNSDFGAYVAKSSDEEVFTATSSGDGAPVNHSVEVLALATNHRLSSKAYDSVDANVTSGTYSFSSATDSFDVIIDGTNNTLTGMRDAINDSVDNKTVSASIINVDGGSRLILTAQESGVEGQVSMTRGGNNVVGDESADFQEITAATDASLVVHGFPVTRSSNTINDVITGVTLDLTGTGTSTIDSRRDLTSLKEAVDEFVTQYNSMSDSLSSIGSTDLSGDQLTRGVDSRVRSLFFNSVDLGDGDSTTALDMGFTFDRDGNLSVDTKRYEAALEKGVNRYVDAFSRSETGIATIFSNLVDEYTSADGIIASREDGVDTRKSSIDDQIERLEYRIEKTNARLRRQFTAMDLAVSNLQQTSGFLASRLGTTNNQ